MQSKYKKGIVVTLISSAVFALILVLAGLSRVQEEQWALSYNHITANYSGGDVFGPGLYHIGVASSMVRVERKQQTMAYTNLTTYSSDFYPVTASLSVTLLYNFTTNADYNDLASFYELFGESPNDILRPLVENQILVILSSQNSSFYQTTSNANSVLEAAIGTEVSSVVGRWVGVTVNVIIESVICEGTTSNTEIIDRQIESLIHDLDRTGSERVELSDYYSAVWDQKQFEINSTFAAMGLRASQLQRILNNYGTGQSGNQVTQILYQNQPLEYNMNLVDILDELASIANRTFPY